MILSNVDNEMKIFLKNYKRPTNFNRVLSGMRPTGKIHLGNYFGALKPWLELQETLYKKGLKHTSYFFIADYHALTTGYEDVSNLKENIKNMMIDFLAVGLDPEKSVLFVQSHNEAHSEAYLLFGMITSVKLLERNPTYKELKENLKEKDLATYGFLGYPVLQTADILLYDPDIVPVGIDQVPHIFITNEIGRKFNNLFKPIFKEVKPYLSETPKLPGLDGRKMSKSYGNCIYLSDSKEEILKKVRSMKTDPNRIRKTDPGNPENCTVYLYHKVFAKELNLGEDFLKEIEEGCKKAKFGCVDCKKKLAQNIISFLEPIWEKRNYYQTNFDKVLEIFKEGDKLASAYAKEKVRQMKEAVNLFLF